MGTITGYTAGRMLEIEEQSVVSGNVIGNDLILVTRGGTQINAGNVRGATGPVGPMGSVTPAELDAVNDALSALISGLDTELGAVDTRVTELESVRACRVNLVDGAIATTATVNDINFLSTAVRLPLGDFAVSNAGYIEVVKAGTYEIHANFTYNISDNPSMPDFLRARLINYDTASAYYAALLPAGRVGYQHATLQTIVTLAANTKIALGLGSPTGTAGATLYDGGQLSVKRL